MNRARGCFQALATWQYKLQTFPNIHLKFQQITILSFIQIIPITANKTTRSMLDKLSMKAVMTSRSTARQNRVMEVTSIVKLTSQSLHSIAFYNFSLPQLEKENLV